MSADWFSAPFTATARCSCGNSTATGRCIEKASDRPMEVRRDAARLEGGLRLPRAPHAVAVAGKCIARAANSVGVLLGPGACAPIFRERGTALLREAGGGCRRRALHHVLCAERGVFRPSVYAMRDVLLAGARRSVHGYHCVDAPSCRPRASRRSCAFNDNSTEPRLRRAAPRPRAPRRRLRAPQRLPPSRRLAAAAGHAAARARRRGCSDRRVPPSSTMSTRSRASRSRDARGLGGGAR